MHHVFATMRLGSGLLLAALVLAAAVPPASAAPAAAESSYIETPPPPQGPPLPFSDAVRRRSHRHRPAPRKRRRQSRDRGTPGDGRGEAHPGARRLQDGRLRVGDGVLHRSLALRHLQRHLRRLLPWPSSGARLHRREQARSRGAFRAAGSRSEGPAPVNRREFNQSLAGAAVAAAASSLAGGAPPPARTPPPAASVSANARTLYHGALILDCNSSPPEERLPLPPA